LKLRMPRSLESGLTLMNVANDSFHYEKQLIDEIECIPA
jgi:hypothetical protein